MIPVVAEREFIAFVSATKSVPSVTETVPVPFVAFESVVARVNVRAAAVWTDVILAAVVAVAKTPVSVVLALMSPATSLAVSPAAAAAVVAHPRGPRLYRFLAHHPGFGYQLLRC